MDYTLESYRNRTSEAINTFDVANASLYYGTKKSPWSFELMAENIFDVEYRQRNSFSSILVSDEKTFILP